MRWEALFADLEGQLASARADQWHVEVAERTRGERTAVTLAQRLAGAGGAALVITLADGTALAGTVVDSAAEWVLIADDHRRHLVALASIAAIEGLEGPGAVLSQVERRLPLRSPLRALSRDRVRVRVRASGAEVVGVIAAVRDDHIDVAREGGPARRVAIATHSLLSVSSV